MPSSSGRPAGTPAWVCKDSKFVSHPPGSEAPALPRCAAAAPPNHDSPYPLPAKQAQVPYSQFELGNGHTWQAADSG
jgi:hypothetical protein